MENIRKLNIGIFARKDKDVLACGADMKNRVSFFSKGIFYFTDDTGDLSDARNFEKFNSGIDKIQKMLCDSGVKPSLVTYDMHPAYLSSSIAKRFPELQAIPVQHHHAHIASVMAEAGIQEPVIGVSFDGTGYGLDGNLWGGEFLIVSPAGFRRAGHLEYMKMPGGEAVVREPWRMAFSLLYAYLGRKALENGFSYLNIRHKECQFLKTMIDRNANTWLTSSCGRLFDAIAVILGIIQVVSFEAQAAILLEQKAALVEDNTFYCFDIVRQGKAYVIGYKPVLSKILLELKNGTPIENIARRFHNSLALMILEVVKLIRNNSGLKKVALSGGVFQNKLLNTMAITSLREEGFEVFENQYVPVNDLGICLGQTYAALNR